MRKDLALALAAKAQQVAATFSRPDRPKNAQGETFKLVSLVPLSDATALGTYEKQPSGKRAICFFYWLALGNGPRWEGFFPSDSHVLGMRQVEARLLDVERYNFRFNFDAAARPVEGVAA